MATVKSPEVIVIPKLDIRTISITLIGDSKLVCHAWSEKARKQILDKKMQKASKGREVCVPEDEYLACLYPMDGGGYGFPGNGFKASAVSAANDVGLQMTKARRAFHVGVEGDDLVRIYGEPRMREDMVRVGMGAADLRFRAEFPEWFAVLDIHYNASVLSAEQIINLFSLAGFAVGIGEYRPQRSGSWGMFHVKNAEDEANPKYFIKKKEA